LRLSAQAPDRASDAEALAPLKACRSARDRLLVLLLAHGRGCAVARSSDCAVRTFTS